MFANLLQIGIAKQVLYDILNNSRAWRRGAVNCHLQWLVQFEPPIFFSLTREKKTGRSRSKRKERLESLVENFRFCFYKREDLIDLPVLLFPLPLLPGAKEKFIKNLTLRRSPLSLHWALKKLGVSLDGGCSSAGEV